MNNQTRAPIVLVVFFLCVVSACTSDTDPLPGCGDLGSGALAVRVGAVLAAANRFETQSAAINADLAEVCGQMASDLGLDVPAAANPAEANCEAVRVEIDSIQAELAGFGIINVTSEPPRCYVSAGATSDCLAECDVSYDASAGLECMGGEVRGTCAANCTGSCSLEGELTCVGRCEGSCAGTCSGSCNGTCDGTCSLEDATGKCIGECDGACEGRCDAECIGTCTGTCTAMVLGVCGGTCEGSCSAEFVEPSCTGDTNASADADCRVACSAELRVDAQCDPPALTVSANGIASDSRAALLVNTLELHWGDFLAIAAKLQGVASSGRALADSTVALSGSVGDLGVQAGACLTVAGQAVASALADVQVSVSVTVELQGAVSSS